MKPLILKVCAICLMAIQPVVFGQSWLVSVSPSQNALNVDPTADILIAFNQDIDPATLTNNTIRVHGSQSGWHLSANISYNSAAQTATFDPDTDFKLGEIVQVTLTTGIQNNIGNPMPDPFGWSFTVGAQSGSGLFVEGDSTDISSFSWGIIAGDWDGDGNLDLATANDNNFQGTTVSILENDGHAHYSEIAAITVGSHPRNLTAGDFDSDGDLDIAVVVTYASKITILVNDGSGNFSLFLPTATVNNAIDLTAADFDGNGTLDLVIASAGALSTLSNDGSGDFTVASVTPVVYIQSAVTSGDFDGDGDFDLAATGWPSDTLAIFLNNGNGNFSQSSILNMERTISSPSTGDVDNDGDLDLLLTRANSAGFSILVNDGNANFALSAAIPITFPSTDIEPADYDSDGDLDLALAAGWLIVFQNEGALNFTQTGQHAPLGEGIIGIASGDLDNDGDLDLAMTSYRNAVVIYKNRQMEQDISFSTDAIDFGVAKIDSTRSRIFKVFNLGVAQDLEISNISSSNPVFSANPASGIIPPGDSLLVMVSFTPTAGSTYRDSLAIFSNDPDIPQMAVHVNGHGYPIISTVPGQNALNVAPDANILIAFAEDMDPASFTNNSLRVYASHSAYHLSGNIVYNPAARELTFDPDSDFLIGENVEVTLTRSIQTLSGDSLPAAYQWGFRILALDGSAVFEDTLAKPVGNFANSMTTGDIDNDGDLDFAVSRETYFDTWLNDGNGNLTLGSTVNIGFHAHSLSALDIDSDGDLDIMAGSGNSDQIAFFTNNGNGVFTYTSTLLVGYDSSPVFKGDFNGDGYLDLMVARVPWGNLSFFINDRNGGFTLGSSITTSINALAQGDIDNDGDVDIIVGSYSPQHTLFILENDGQAGFAQTSSVTLGFPVPIRIAVNDLNGDGAVDLAIAYEFDKVMSFLANDGSGIFNEYATLNFGTAIYTPDVAGDFDGDGDIDLALNLYAYSAPQPPISILTNNGNGFFTEFSTVAINPDGSLKGGDFDGDGDFDLAFLKFDSNTQNIIILKNGPPVGIDEDPTPFPKQFALHQNYPNPFNPATTIRYDLPKPAQVNLTIYNILGQKVRTLVNAYETAGYKSVTWDGKNELGYPISSGLYIYRIEAGDFHRSLKLLLVR